VQAVEGGITVRGSNRRDVLVIARERGQQQRPPASAGTALRQLAQTPPFLLEEERNRISITVQSHRVIDLDIQVPSHTNMRLICANNGEVVVEGIEGDLEISNPNGPITLNGVGGSIVANSVNDKVKAKVTSLSAERPMAFSSLVGDVDVTFPASLKANLKLRSDEGRVFTDFDVSALPRPAPTGDTRRESGRLHIEVRPSVYGAVGGGGPEIELRTFNGNVYVRRAP